MKRIYTPLQPGIPKRFRPHVSYAESRPRDPALQKAVACTWQLKTLTPLAEDFSYLIFPDCCIDIVIDLNESDDTLLVMTPATTAIQIGLGTQFNYVGMRTLPGAWNNTWGIPASAIVSAPDPIPVQLPGLGCACEGVMQNNPSSVAEQLEHIILQHGVSFLPMPTYIEHLLGGHSVQDTALQTGYSTRQLNRNVRSETGYTPRDLTRLAKLQRVIRDVQSTEYLQEYADQPHFIREFKRITGYTPSEYSNVF